MASGATRFRAPQTDELAPASARLLLVTASDAVARRWENAAVLRGDATPAVQALRVLTAVIVSGLDGQPTTSLTSQPWTAEAPRFIAGLRRELLSLAPRTRIPAEELLTVLTVMDRLERELDADASAQFAEHVLGTNALELLVEIAHDMRSPLSSIQLLVERMRAGQTGPVTPMQERHLSLVFSAAFGLSALASDVMELAHGGARLVTPLAVPFSIAELLHVVRDVVQPIAEEKRLTLRFSGPERDLRVGHPAALHRVLLNLVTNALKFTASGSVTLQLSEEPDGVVQFLVADTGRGLPDAVSARLAASSASEPSETRGRAVFSSAGLGLAICQRLVSAMGGQLALRETGPGGTQLAFALHLPVPVPVPCSA